MLSRTAERVYWMARYLERVEDTARLINAHWQGLMETPASPNTRPDWLVLVSAIDAEAAFDERYKTATERNVMKFMVADADNPSSVAWSVQALRENARTTREVIPPGAWEMVNELHLLLKDRSSEALTRRNRYEFIHQVLLLCHVVGGLIDSSLCRGLPFEFFRAGRALERADMTTRILDGNSQALRDRPAGDPFATQRWRQVLHSINALPVYRQVVGPRVQREETIEFLLRSAECPRSVAYCLEELAAMLPRIPAGEGLKPAVRRVRRRLIKMTKTQLSDDKIHDTLDRLQMSLTRLDARLRYQYFEVG